MDVFLGRRLLGAAAITKLASGTGVMGGRLAAVLKEERCRRRRRGELSELWSEAATQDEFCRSEGKEGMTE